MGVLRYAGILVYQGEINKYTKDSQVIKRRYLHARLVALLFLAGADVFCADMQALKTSPAYLPAFALRRNKTQNVMGSSRFMGICNAGAWAYVFYHADDAGIYLNSERRAAGNLVSRLNTSKSSLAMILGVTF